MGKNCFCQYVHYIAIYSLNCEVLFIREIITYFACLLISKNMLCGNVKFHIVVKLCEDKHKGNLFSLVTGGVLHLSVKITAGK